MRLFWAFILGLIAALMSNVTANTFERWLNKQSKYKNLSVGWKLLIAAGTFSVISVSVYLLPPGSASRTFDFQARVQDKKYRDITNAQVTLDVGGEIAPSDGFTDSGGLVRIFVDSTRAGKPGWLKIEAEGYEPYTQYIDLNEDELPKVIQLSQKIQTENKQESTPTHVPGQSESLAADNTEGIVKLTPNLHAEMNFVDTHDDQTAPPDYKQLEDLKIRNFYPYVDRVAGPRLNVKVRPSGQ